jgi:hypothetical protein
MVVYAVASSRTEKAVETFVRREEAERFLENVRADSPKSLGNFGSNRSTRPTQCPKSSR